MSLNGCACPCSNISYDSTPDGITVLVHSHTYAILPLLSSAIPTHIIAWLVTVAFDNIYFLAASSCLLFSHCIVVGAFLQSLVVHPINPDSPWHMQQQQARNLDSFFVTCFVRAIRFVKWR